MTVVVFVCLYVHTALSAVLMVWGGFLFVRLIVLGDISFGGDWVFLDKGSEIMPGFVSWSLGDVGGRVEGHGLEG